MIIEIVSIGTELLLGEILDTNAQFLSEELRDLGAQVFFRSTVGDNLERLTACLQQALDRSDAVITTGGLGPTDGDITRDAVARVFGERQTEDPELVAALEALFLSHGRRMADRNRKQATTIPSATVLPNATGTAPGWLVRKGGKILICLPGPSHEARHMWHQAAKPALNVPGAAFFVHHVHVLGIGESDLIERLGDLPKRANPSVATYSKPHGIDIRICAAGPDPVAAEALARPCLEEVRKVVLPYAYGENHRTLAEAVLDRLTADGYSLGIIEGATHGLIGQSLINAGPRSRAFHGGMLLNPHSALEAPMVPTPPPAPADPQARVLTLAKLARTLAQSSWGLATLPGSDFKVTEGIASGKVFIGLSGPALDRVREFHWPGALSYFTQRVAAQALFFLWQELAPAAAKAA